MPRRITEYRRGADHFLTKKLYVMELLRAVTAAGVIAAALIVAGVATIRILHDVSRSCGRIVVSELPAYIVPQIKRLRVLAGRKLCSKELLVLLGNLRVLCCQLLRGQALVDAAETAVHGVDDIAGAVLHRVPGVTCLRRKVVVDALDRFSCVAAIMLSQRLFILCFSRFPREFRLYLHPPFR